MAAKAKARKRKASLEAGPGKKAKKSENTPLYRKLRSRTGRRAHRLTVKPLFEPDIQASTVAGILAVEPGKEAHAFLKTGLGLSALQPVGNLLARRPGLLAHAVGEQLKGALLERMFGVSAQSTFFRAAAEEHLPPALVGLGYGYKDTAGLADLVPAVRVYVEKKLPEAQVAPRDRIPKDIEGVPTDVIETGRIQSHRPIAGGDAIGHVNLPGDGTLGCIVEREGERYVLSNAHVLAHLVSGVFQGRKNDAIIHPSRGAGGTAANRVAALTEFETIRFGQFDENWIDAAIAKVDNPNDVELNLRGLGSFESPDISPSTASGQSLAVSKFGQKTAVTHGQVRGYQEDVRVWYGAKLAFFKLQLAVRGDNGGLFSEPGDSGSLVISKTAPRRPVGLLFAGGDSGPSFVTPMERLLSHFRARIVYP